MDGGQRQDERVMVQGKSGRSDAYSVSYILSGSIIVMSAVILKEYGKTGLFLLTSIAAFVWIASAIVALCLSLVRRCWRRSISIVLMPVIVLLVGLSAHFSGLSADKARLIVWKSSYLADMATLPDAPGAIRIKIWPWGSYTGGMLAGSREEVEVLVYDSSDQIVLPRQVRSTEWFSSADREGYKKSVFIYPELGEGGPHIVEENISVKQIGHHFYIIWMEL